MIAQGDRVIAGVSGGADSVCLFFVLSELKQTLDFELIAVHVNHGLRGESADADEQFVRALCRQYNVSLEVSRVNLELIAKNRKQSLEEAGRNVRREAFAAAMKKYGANKIALAHHQNDNAETLLWNLCRGSGLTGLGGIRPVNGCYIRPLLCMTRKEIETFLEKRGQPYCTDETNSGTDYTRNRLRHLILPVLEEKSNTQSVRHMNEAMQQMQELREYMESQAQNAQRECTKWESAECCLIDKERFLAYPRILRTFIIRSCLESLHGQLADFGQIHVEEILNLFDRQAGRKLCLPGRLTARRVYEGVQLCADVGKETEEQNNAFVLPSVFLNIPGETCLPEQGLTARCRIIKKPDTFSMKEIPENIYTKWFDYDIIKKDCAFIEKGLCIRSKIPGDCITIDKSGHSKKLKSWFVNEKIPAGERAEISLLAKGNDILWIIGHRMSCAYQVSEQTEQILQIEISEYKR